VPKNAVCKCKGKGWFPGTKMALGQQRFLQCKEEYMSNSEWLTCYAGRANDLFMYYGETDKFQVIFHASVMNALYSSVLKVEL
jgi:hypothetical protein